MLLAWLWSALAFLLAALVVPGFRVDGFWHALLAALVLGFCNALVRPVIILLTWPLTVLTLGLFLLVVNGLVMTLVVWLVPGVAVANFGVAIVVAIIIALVNAIAGRLLG